MPLSTKNTKALEVRLLLHGNLVLKRFGGEESARYCAQFRRKWDKLQAEKCTAPRPANSGTCGAAILLSSRKEGRGREANFFRQMTRNFGVTTTDHWTRSYKAVQNNGNKAIAEDRSALCQPSQNASAIISILYSNTYIRTEYDKKEQEEKTFTPRRNMQGGQVRNYLQCYRYVCVVSRHDSSPEIATSCSAVGRF